MAVLLPVRRVPSRARRRRVRVRPASFGVPFAAPFALFCRLPFIVQFALVEALAVGLAALIGTVLGGAAAACDLGLK